MSDAPRCERREVHYRGHVQGVGFRFTTRDLARRFEVCGFVRNLSDGRVHVVAEGEANELDAFFQSLAERMAHCIQETKVDVSSVSGEFDSFSIRF